MQRMPVFFLSHGGGPWPWVDGMRPAFARTEQAFKRLPERLPHAPRAVLVISGHWEADVFTSSSAEWPPTLYDYSGFPEHTYRLRYPAPGDPALAVRITELLQEQGLAAGTSATQGLDHGAFVPLSLMYPDAGIPVVLLSLHAGYDPARHLAAGRALQSLRDDGVLIIGSGLTYHNMRGFNRPESGPVSKIFEQWLTHTLCAENADFRAQRLIEWEQAPGARLAHPREDHLLPLMVVAGAAGTDRGAILFEEHAMQVSMASYIFDAN